MKLRTLVFIAVLAALLSLMTATAQASPPENGAPGLDRAIAAKALRVDALMNIAGVVGMGVAYDSNANAVIKVYIQSDAAGKSIPDELDGVPVEKQVTGMIMAFTDPTARLDRPVPTGVSTGHPDITAGTIGARVKDAEGNVYALSNNHVYANSNKASIGDNVLQPGPYDGGVDPGDAIGTLADYQAIAFNGPTNYIDAAIALTTTSQLGYATPEDDGYGAPSADTVGAYLNMPVQKYGRTTGLTHGYVQATDVTVNVCYEAGRIFCKKWARFEDQIQVGPGGFSAGGDSGSLIITDNQYKHPVALLFAGSDTTTFANPIDLVLSRFGVTIDSGDESVNNPPTASFTYSCIGLTCEFDASASVDSDGSIVSYGWTFGDDSTGTGVTATHTYSADGSYDVELTVTDNEGANAVASENTTVTLPENSDPTASFTYSCTGLTCEFDASASVDWDGSIVSYGWSFGDDSTGTGVIATHTYSAGGSYDVELTVTDDEAGVGIDSQQVAVVVPTEPPTTGSVYVTSLQGTPEKVRSNWAATVTIEIKSDAGPVEGAVVSGHWDDGAAATCTTGTAGTCSIYSGIINKHIVSVVWTVDDVTLEGYTYDSTGDFVVIHRPK